MENLLDKGLENLEVDIEKLDNGDSGNTKAALGTIFCILVDIRNRLDRLEKQNIINKGPCIR